MSDWRFDRYIDIGDSQLARIIDERDETVCLTDDPNHVLRENELANLARNAGLAGVDATGSYVGEGDFIKIVTCGLREDHAPHLWHNGRRFCAAGGYIEDTDVS